MDQKQRKRKKRRKKRQKALFSRFLTTLAIILLAIPLLGALGAIGVNFYFGKKTGTSIYECAIEARETVLNCSPEDFVINKTTYILDDNSSVIAKLSDGSASNHLYYDDIPKDVINAFIAVEDQSYWTNPGFDIKGMARVLVNYFKTKGDVAQGASTITQQLARSVFLTREKSMLRKVKEIFIAYYLTQKYDKEHLMEYYVNNCCFANNIYGIKDAAKKYFDCSVDELSLSQIAYLCAIPNRPSYYDPLTNSQNAIERRDKILKDMLECGFISQEQCEKALAEKISIAEDATDDSIFHNYATTYAVKCAVEYLMEQDGFELRYHFDSEEDYGSYQSDYAQAYEVFEKELYTGGYYVYTSLNISSINRLQSSLDFGLNFDNETNEKTGIYNLQGSLTVIDNETGKVVALVGGRSQTATANSYSLNRAFQVNRQPGSSIKPLLVYTPAFQQKIATPSTTLKNIDVQSAYKNQDKIQQMGGGSVTLRHAVEQSINGCALYLYDQVDPEKALPYLEKMSFGKIMPDDYRLSSGLGGLTYGTNTEEMANAYYTLANHGKYQDATCITSIKTYMGEEIYQEKEERKIYSRKAADTMTDVLTGVFTRGTAASMGWSSISENMPAAGKTGTTNDSKDGWFCGYTPYYTICVWVGKDDNSEVPDMWGSTYPATIWKEAMLVMLGDKPVKDFDLKAMSD